MEVYAALIDNLDQNIGRYIDFLEKSGVIENTLIILTSLRDDVAAVLATQHIEAPLVERVETVAQAGQLAQHRLNNGVAR